MTLHQVNVSSPSILILEDEIMIARSLENTARNFGQVEIALKLGFWIGSNGSTDIRCRITVVKHRSVGFTRLFKRVLDGVEMRGILIESRLALSRLAAPGLVLPFMYHNPDESCCL